MPRSSAAPMTSASRSEPPGWITARTPRPRLRQARPKRKEASDAMTLPSIENGILRLHRGDACGDYPACLTGADADCAAIAREHDCIGLDVFADAPGEQEISEFRHIGLRRVTGFSAAASTMPASRACASRPPATDFSSTAGGEIPPSGPVRSTRTFCFEPRAASASGE